MEKPDKGRGGSQARVWLQLDCALREFGSRKSWAFICPSYRSLLIATVVGSETQERVLVTQSCPTLCDPMDCSPSSSSVHGILQARILEEAAIPFSRDLPNPGVKLGLSVLQADTLVSEPPGKPPLNSKVCPILHMWAKWLSKPSDLPSRRTKAKAIKSKNKHEPGERERNDQRD